MQSKLLGRTRHPELQEIVVKMKLDGSDENEKALLDYPRENCSSDSLERRISEADASAAISFKSEIVDGEEIVNLVGHPAFVGTNIESFYDAQVGVAEEVSEGRLSKRDFVNSIYDVLNADLEKHITGWEGINCKSSSIVAESEVADDHKDAFRRVGEAKKIGAEKASIERIRTFLGSVSSNLSQQGSIDLLRFDIPGQGYSVMGGSDGGLLSQQSIERAIKDWESVPENLDNIIQYFKTGVLDKSDAVEGGSELQEGAKAASSNTSDVVVSTVEIPEQEGKDAATAVPSLEVKASLITQAFTKFLGKEPNPTGRFG